MNMKEFLDYIADFAVDGGLEDCPFRDQLRSLFTAWCILFNVEVDTKACDDALGTIYFRGAYEECISYDSFEEFMLEHLI